VHPLSAAHVHESHNTLFFPAPSTGLSVRRWAVFGYVGKSWVCGSNIPYCAAIVFDNSYQLVLPIRYFRKNNQSPVQLDFHLQILIFENKEKHRSGSAADLKYEVFQEEGF
jgi:hypothetical protein